MVLALLLVGAEYFQAFPLRVATGDSLPKGLYWTTELSLTRGSIVLVCLPIETATLGRVRGYLKSGSCPGGARPIGKPVGAIAGDFISLGDGGIRVNGVWISDHDPSEADAQGRRLAPIPDGVYEVASGEVWLISNHHPRSWDSRYFGPVAIDMVLGELRPLWSFPALGSARPLR